MTKNEAASVAKLTDEQIVRGGEQFFDCARSWKQGSTIRDQDCAISIYRAILAQAAPPAAPVQEAKADQMADRQYRAGFLAGWNAGVDGNTEKLLGVQNRVGPLSAYLAAPAAPSTGEAGAEPKCAMCNDIGMIGGRSGQTPESYEEWAEPCPDCNAEYKSVAPLPQHQCDLISTMIDEWYYHADKHVKEKLAKYSQVLLSSATPPTAKSEAASQPGEMGAGVQEPRCDVCGAKTTDPWLDHRGCQQLASAQQDEREALNKWKADCKSWGHPATPLAAAAYIDGYRAAQQAQAGGEDKRDTERLDWLAQHGAWVAWGRDGEFCRVFHHSDDEDGRAVPFCGWGEGKCYPTAREAIDAALSREQPQGGDRG